MTKTISQLLEDIKKHRIMFSNGSLLFEKEPKNKRFWSNLNKEYFINLRIEKAFLFDNGIIIEVNNKDKDNEYPHENWQLILPPVKCSMDLSAAEIQTTIFHFSFKREIKE